MLTSKGNPARGWTCLLLWEWHTMMGHRFLIFFCAINIWPKAGISLINHPLPWARPSIMTRSVEETQTFALAIICQLLAAFYYKDIFCSLPLSVLYSSPDHSFDLSTVQSRNFSLIETSLFTLPRAGKKEELYAFLRPSAKCFVKERQSKSR